ncbi:MAG TPA: penicillin-binding protein 2 [Patescibacteria group bacterium]|nr:penicillin-binding protein 2 [Patescibacteria group bacterium]
MDIFDYFDRKILGDHKTRTIKRDFDEIGDLAGDDSALSDVKKSQHFYLFYLIIIAVFVVLVYRLWNLQLTQGAHFRYLSEGNRIRTTVTTSTRGVIYDQGGNILVSNVPSFVLQVTPQDLPKKQADKNALIQKVAKATGITALEISNKIKPELAEPQVLVENIEREKALAWKEQLANLAAFSVEERATRQYKSEAALAHILGYVGKINQKEYDELGSQGYTMLDLIGKTGLENFYEKELKGKNGKKQVEVDAMGKISRILAQSNPEAGNSLVLNLDLGLQKKMTSVLEKAVTNSKSTGAAAVAINPQNGAVLGMVSVPSFDNNIFTTQSSQQFAPQYQQLITDPKKPLYNRAISGVYPPGSTIKMLVGSAGLQEGVINVNTHLFAQEAILVPNKYDPSIVYRFPDWKPGGHGYVNVISSIAKSCDVFFYAVGGGYEQISGLGIDKLYQYFKKYGLGDKTGIDLAGENSGLAPNPDWKKKAKKEDWYFGDTYHVSIGQGDLLVTPIQLADYVAAVANGGSLLKPHLIWKIQDSEGNVIKEYTKDVKTANIVSPENMEIIRRGMREAVTSGTAKILSALPVSSAGKTGTAQFDNNAKTHSWFASFAPYDNPTIALVVLAEGGGEGHEVAAPAAKEILQYYFSRK